MTDATIITLAAAASPLIVSLAALLRSYANSLDIRSNNEKIKALHDEAKSAKARVDNLEIGNLADAAAKGQNGNKQ